MGSLSDVGDGRFGMYALFDVILFVSLFVFAFLYNLLNVKISFVLRNILFVSKIKSIDFPNWEIILILQ